MHTHLDTEKAENYRSKISGIPRNQFYKTYSKPNSASKGKKGALPYGTFDIYVCNTKLFLQTIGQIERLKQLRNVADKSTENILSTCAIICANVS